MLSDLAADFGAWYTSGDMNMTGGITWPRGMDTVIIIVDDSLAVPSPYCVF